MADLIYSTQIDEREPWLVSEEQLRSLDDVLDAEWQRLERYNSRQVEAQASALIKDGLEFCGPGEEKISEEEKMRRATKRAEEFHGLWRSKRDLILHLPDGKKLPLSSFAEGAGHPDAVEETPVGFSLTMERGEMCIDMTLKADGWLYLRVSPERASVSREVFVSLQQWVDSVRAGWLIRTWYKFKLYGVHVILVPIVVVGAALLLARGSLQTRQELWSYQEKAEALLSHGVGPGQENEALELILALVSDYQRPDQCVTLVPPGLGSVTAVVLVVLVLAVLCFPPRTAIGLGRGKAKLRRWQKWIKFLSVTMPTAVLMSFVLPRVLEFLEDLLHK